MSDDSHEDDMDLFYGISPEEKERAIQCIIKEVPQEELGEVLKLVKTEGEDWWIMEHLDFGMGIRNLLRENGFEWDALQLDDLWDVLVEEAAQRIHAVR